MAWSPRNVPPALCPSKVPPELSGDPYRHFGQGLVKGRLDLLMSVYTPDVVFVETPFSEPLRGIDAVRRYWADVPYHQSEVTFTSGEIYAAGPWFSTEFKCVFRRRRTGEWVEARGPSSVRPPGSGSAR